MLLRNSCETLEFNRQAMAIPARDLGCAEAAEGLVFDDDVLENLVQRRADVNVAVGKWWAVVQDKFLFAGASCLNFLVEFRVLHFFNVPVRA